MKIIIVFADVLLTGCVALNQSLTPDAEVTIDKFDGHKEVYQEPVSAAKSLSDGWNLLGFRWRDDQPNVVYLLAGAEGYTNITGLEFNADGKIIQPTLASHLTDIQKWSKRQFRVPMDDFLILASAHDVRMKVVFIDQYQVSHFGKNNAGAIVNGKFSDFIKQIEGAL